MAAATFPIENRKEVRDKTVSGPKFVAYLHCLAVTIENIKTFLFGCSTAKVQLCNKRLLARLLGAATSQKIK